ncbi:hypothetical protein ACEPAH_5306 [Sanghuangporus vaninii]
MKDLYARLDSVFMTVREKAPRVERHHNLVTLPDEILSYIIKLTCEDARGQGFWVLGCNAVDRLVVNLSLVSRRFRNAVIDTPSLWACIDNCYCLGSGFGERIKRSKRSPLTLFIDLGVKSGERQNILSQIIPIKDRCQRLCARVDANAAREVPVTEFLSTESLDLSFTGREQLEGSDSLFTKWAFPNTTLLRITNATPPPGLFPKVITCILSYYAVEELMLGVGGFPHGGRLLQMLVSMPQLKHLSVYFIGWSISSPITLVPVTILSISTVTLGHKTFISPSRGSVSHLRWILESLILPNVKDLHLQVTSLTIEGRSHLSHNVIYPLIVLFRNIQILELKTYNIPKSLLGLEQNLELDQLRVFVPREPYTSNPVHIERGDLDMLTRYPDDVRIA